MVDKMVNKNIPVRALVEFLMRRGDLTTNFNISLRSSMNPGIRTHQKIQKSRPLPYAAEVPVSYSIKSGNYSFNIQGRIDGLYEMGDTVVIEEIKTTYQNLDVFQEQNDSLHWSQLKVYSAIYAIENNLDRILAQLTYCRIGTCDIRTYFREFRIDELKNFFGSLIALYTKWIDKINNWHEERNKEIDRSDFPFTSYRKGQLQMIQDVFATIEDQEQIIIQAPTGIGKTVSVLYPAIKALAEKYTQKIFFLTSRTTGRLIAVETLKELKKSGLKAKFITLTAKEKICFNPDKNCSGEDCEFAKGYYDRIGKAREILFTEDAFTADKIAAIAREYQLCPFELSLDLALWVDCIICDLNYAFDPRVYLRRFFLNNSTHCTFLVDEAHNLIDRSREMFSAQIEKSDFLSLRRLISNKNSNVYKIAGDINARMLKMKKTLMQEKSVKENELPEYLLFPLRKLVRNLEQWIFNHPQSSQSRQLLDHYFAVFWFLKVSEYYNGDYVTYIEKTERNLKVKLYCIHPSDQLREAFTRARSTVLFSATVTPMSYFAHILGLQNKAEKRIFPSPFPSENLCVMLLDTVSTLYRHRAHTKEALTQTIGTFVEAKKGNYMVYFPSYEYLKMVYPLYKEIFPHHKILIQTHEMHEMERTNFLKNFTAENSRTTVGFVVMGGIFAEAIDLVGDRLTGAVIVGVGLPGISMERELIHYHYNEHQFPGFDYAYRFPGLIRVFQAAGRVIRTENDRGAILLIDKRYNRPDYTSLLPPEWRVRKVANNQQMSQTLEEFWQEAY
jgi:DNA excision repair protein ERCC-2